MAPWTVPFPAGGHDLEGTALDLQRAAFSERQGDLAVGVVEDALKG